MSPALLGSGVCSLIICTSTGPPPCCRSSHPSARALGRVSIGTGRYVTRETGIENDQHYFLAVVLF